MKKIPTILLVLLIASLAGCSPSPPENSCITTAMHDFSQNLFHEVLATDDQNPIISPLSLYYVLAMIMLGAQEDTLSELEAVLGIPRCLLAPELFTHAKSLFSIMGSTELNLAGSIWLTDELTINNRFNQNMINYFNAPTFERNLQESSTVDEINRWIYGQTNGHIQNIIDDLCRNTIILLVNTLYLNARWANDFNPMYIKSDVFHLETGKEIVVPFLTTGIFTSFYSLVTACYEAVMLPYDDGRLGLFLVRPTTNITIRDFVAANDLICILRRLEEPMHLGIPGLGVAVNVPKLNVSYNISMNDILKEMGLKSAFDERANFFDIVEEDVEDVIFISEVAHATSIKIHVKGTEAAATTYILGQRMTTPPPTLTFNTPYVYLIYDSLTSSILFMGIVDDPS